MRRRLIVVGALTLVVVGLAIGVRPDDRPTALPARARAPQPRLEPEVIRTATPPVRDPLEAPFARRVDALVEGCGIDPWPRCREGVCVAVMAAPDLDHAWGWMQLAARRPMFALTAAATDLGLPTAALPCRQAVDGLAGAGTLTVDREDGSELWCTTEHAELPAARRLCDEVATERYGERGRFVAAGAGVRVLRLAPP